jgi:hypothetical protein
MSCSFGLWDGLALRPEGFPRVHLRLARAVHRCRRQRVHLRVVLAAARRGARGVTQREGRRGEASNGERRRRGRQDLPARGHAVAAAAAADTTAGAGAGTGAGATLRGHGHRGEMSPGKTVQRALCGDEGGRGGRQGEEEGGEEGLGHGE